MRKVLASTSSLSVMPRPSTLASFPTSIELSGKRIRRSFTSGDQNIFVGGCASSIGTSTAIRNQAILKLANLALATVDWASAEDYPKAEDDLIRIFEKATGAKPFGNRAAAAKPKPIST